MSLRGTDKPTEIEISRAVTELLDRAEQGPTNQPKSKKDHRVAARTRSVPAASSWLPEGAPPQPQEPPQPAAAGSDITEEDEELADVIPLGVFDAREEAKKRW
ncbi:hypothetical protein [Amycolatopsis sp. YIM 10]|uniref:hypothetical protein n=1 Tax=Amycolatopsis sp. YIM 10 TaxID=2653857 RepID=UPI001290816D|nr:hypothetical protein [Amycolatopsis sp. YIM 10]